MPPEAKLVPTSRRLTPSGVFLGRWSAPEVLRPNQMSSNESMVDIKRLGAHVGESVTVRGWVEATRGHGKVAFIVLRDGTGTLQGVVVKSVVNESEWELYGSLTQECVVALTGEVKEDARAPGTS